MIYILRNPQGDEIGRSRFPIVLFAGWAMAMDQQWLSLPEGCTVESVADVAGLRAAAWEAAKAKRASVMGGGVLVGQHWFHTDVDSRVQWLGLVLMGEELPPIPWRTMTGNYVELTRPLVLQVFGAIAAREQAVFARGEQLRQAIYGSDLPQSVDINAGWPASFVE